MRSIFQHLFTWLFKYPPRAFARGRLVVLPTLPLAVLVIGLLCAAVLVVAMARGLRGARPLDRAVLIGSRLAAFAVLAACLMRPALAVTTAVPQRNVLAVMVDDSRSMQIRDADTLTRVAAVERAFADSTALMRSLAGRFSVRLFRFSGDPSPVPDVARLTALGARTNVAGSLASVQQELADVPVAGIVMVSDGADNANGDLAATLLALRAQRLPVYTVGVGSERFAHDISVDRLDVPSTTLKGSGAQVTVTLGLRGGGGDTTTITVESDGHIVVRDTVPLPRDRESIDVPLRMPPLDAGLHVITVQASPLPRELVIGNNTAQSTLRVRPGYERVLYFEGEPRFEFSFLRRAFEDDGAVRLVGLLRSAPGKFLRLNVADSLDLLAGFPSRPEELFQYRALILGDVEASFFSGAQLRMIADFVDRRGGALIALGGRSALGEGGYAGTPVAEVLPFTLEHGGRRPADTGVVALKVTPTAEGLRNPAMQLGPTLATSTARWDSLPPLTAVNQLGDIRAGALTLLSGQPLPRGPPHPVLAVQHYGRGVAAVLDAQDTWTWKMDPRAPIADRSYETFWRQLVRWSLDQVPDRVEATATPEQVAPGDEVTLRARVLDSLYRYVNDAHVIADVTTPAGAVETVPLDWTLHDDGTYAATFAAREPGAYQFTVTSVSGTDTTRSAVAGLIADAAGADMQHAELRTSLLERIAGETGGKYYSLSDLSHLPDDVTLTESGIVAHESRDLWDMPVVLLLLIALLGCDWAWRRWRGLA